MSRVLAATGFIAGLAFAFLPVLIVLGGATRQVDGTWYTGAVIFSTLVVAVFATLLRRAAPEVASGLGWSLALFLFGALALWSLVHLPAH
jgi:hypothetical protein